MMNKYQHINNKVFQTSAISTKLDKCQQTKPNVNKYHQYPQIETNSNKFQQISANVNKMSIDTNDDQQISTKKQHI